MEQRKITRDLEYFFSDEEKLEMSRQLAAENQNKRKLEDQKKSVQSQYASQINEKTETINVLSDKLAAGYEFRRIPCIVQYHTPERNKKTLTREDTGESFVEKMTEYDHDLFNQYEQEQAEAGNEQQDLDGAPNIEGEPFGGDYADGLPFGDGPAGEEPGYVSIGDPMIVNNPDGTLSATSRKKGKAKEEDVF